MVFGIQVVIGRWDGKIDLMVVPLDGFDIILSNDLFVATKVAICPMYSVC